MAAKSPNSALDAEIGIGRLLWRCGVASRALMLLALADITVACRDGLQLSPGGAPLTAISARSAQVSRPCLLRTSKTCSRCCACVFRTKSHQMCWGLGSPQMQRKPCRLNHRVRGVNDLSRRAAMDQGGVRFRIQLVSRVRGHAKPADRAAGPRNRVPPHPNVKWTTLCTYTNSRVRPMMRRRPRRRRRMEVLVV